MWLLAIGIDFPVTDSGRRFSNGVFSEQAVLRGGLVASGKRCLQHWVEGDT